MKEIKGDLWEFYGKEGFAVLITTNGFVRKDGKAVMGRGCARQAVSKISSDLPELLGDAIKKYGNVLLRPFGADDAYPECSLLTFPVKHNWWEMANLKLIRKSALALKKLARKSPEYIFVLPRPGCGNGQLLWGNVKPLLTDLPDNVLVIHKR